MEDKIIETKPELTMLEKVTEQVKMLNEANSKTEDLLNRQERLKAEDLLGGKTDGHQEAEVKKEVSDKAYSEMVMRGEVDGE